jgi:hypothetical protein
MQKEAGRKILDAAAGCGGAFRATFALGGMVLGGFSGRT